MPALALFAVPHECQSNCDTPRMKALDAADMAEVTFVKSSNPTVHVIRLPGADHAIYQSNPVDVEREMNAFMYGLH